MDTKLPSVAQTLMDLKTSTDSIQHAAAVLLAHVCQTALRSAASTDAAASFNTEQQQQLQHQHSLGGVDDDDDDDDNDAFISASSVQHQLSNTLLGIVGTDARRAQALLQLLDTIFKTSSSSEPPKPVQTKLAALAPAMATPQHQELVNNAWTVMRTEFATELPPTIVKVVESFRKNGQLPALMVKPLSAWAGGILAQKGFEQQQLVVQALFNTEAQSKLEEQEKLDAEAAAAVQQDEGKGAAAALAARITAADARKRIELLRHLCEGLEAAPVGSADVAALRAALAEFGSETVAKTGGAKRWGSSAAMAGGAAEMRAASFALSGQLDVVGEDAQQDDDDDDDDDAADDVDRDKKPNKKKKLVVLSKDPVSMLVEACDSVDDAIRNLEVTKKRAAARDAATAVVDTAASSSSSSNVTVEGLPQSSAARANIPKRHPLVVPVTTSLVLDRTGEAVAGSKQVLCPDDAPAEERGPKAAPPVLTPFSVSPRISRCGELASRAWACDPDRWATARDSAVDLPWIMVEPEDQEQQQQQQARDEDAASAGKQHTTKVNATAGAALFFGK